MVFVFCFVSPCIFYCGNTWSHNQCALLKSVSLVRQQSQCLLVPLPPTVLAVYSVIWLVKIPLLLLQFTCFIVFVSSWSWLQFRLKCVTIRFWLEYVRNPCNCIKPLSLTIIILWLNDLMICCFCNHVLRLFYQSVAKL